MMLMLVAFSISAVLPTADCKIWLHKHQSSLMRAVTNKNMICRTILLITSDEANGAIIGVDLTYLNRSYNEILRIWGDWSPEKGGI